MPQRFVWQGLEKGFEVLTEHRANPEAQVFLDKTVIVKDLRHPRLLLGVGEKQLEIVALNSVYTRANFVKQRSFARRALNRSAHKDLPCIVFGEIPEVVVPVEATESSFLAAKTKALVKFRLFSRSRQRGGQA